MKVTIRIVLVLSLLLNALYLCAVDQKSKQLEDARMTIYDLEKSIENVGEQNLKLQDEVDWYRQMSNDTRVEIADDERSLIESVVNAEIGGSDVLAEQMAVAQVIHDRMVLWQMPVDDVLSGGQFAPPKQNPSELTKQAVSMVFDYGCLVYNEPVTHFYAYRLVYPSWADNKVARGKDSVHVFMY